MKTQADILALMQERYSCRSFQDTPLSADHIAALTAEADRISGLATPFGPAPGGCRVALVATAPGEEFSLKGLGTYGFIKKPQAFLIAAIKSEDHLEESGWKLEHLVLAAQGLGLGSCWLGGSFRRSKFAQVLEGKFKDFSAPGEDLRIPAVIALGYPDKVKDPKNSWARVKIGGHRKPAGELFFARPATTAPGLPALVSLDPEVLEPTLAQAFGMVRIGPSASNKQPWRVVRNNADESFHFFLCRSPKYRDGFFAKLVGAEDIQRVDSGIAVSHFQAALEAQGVKGTWKKENLEWFSGLSQPDQAATPSQNTSSGEAGGSAPDIKTDGQSAGAAWDYVISFRNA